MPARYEGIKRSMRKKYPNASKDEIQRRAAKVFNSTRKEGEKPVTPGAYERKKGASARTETKASMEEKNKSRIKRRKR
jgi:hypothetical protein